MIRKDFTPQFKPYTQPSRFPDNRPVSKEIIKTDDTVLSAAMVSVINTNNPSEILNFFQTKLGASYKDKDGNTPLHFLMMIDDCVELPSPNNPVPFSIMLCVLS